MLVYMTATMMIENELSGAKLQSNQLGFILASNGIASSNFSLKSLRTGKHFTYKVKKAEEKVGQPDTWFVKYLFGSDNNTDYKYMGMIRNGNFMLTAKSKASGLTVETPVVNAFSWAFHRMVAGQDTPNMEVWHSGKCGRCGRKLTVPESVELGLGPECASKM
jgi:hypothetical protein